MEDITRTARPDYEAEFYKLQEENYRLHKEIKELKETIRAFKAVNVSLASVKATAEAFLKTPIDIDFCRIEDFMKDED